MRELYKSYQAGLDFYNAMAKKYPKQITVKKIGQTWEERDIVVVTLSNNVEKADLKPALLYTGTIHAREWIGHELAFEFVRYVLNNIDIDPWLQKVFTKSTIYIVPCVNPDGFEYSRTHFSFWRKNRRKNSDGTFGVDLNRNFEGPEFNNQIPTFYNTYPGPSAFSEPETRALRDFVDNHTNISIALDYHSQGNVFFPAHNFHHEDAIDATDLNVLCANMAEEIRKVSNREYGIHQGKPPTHLVSGTGREYYYGKGIISTVIEVGTRNISDYLDDMLEHIKEHIPALLVAISEAPNYAKSNPLPRVEQFQVNHQTNSTISLSWKYPNLKNVYFEVYRHRREKKYCNKANLVGMTTAKEFIDPNLESGTLYHYHIRAVNKIQNIKSAYAPVLRVRTQLSGDEFARTYFPIPQETGYVSEKKQAVNAKHFGANSLFVGVSENRGVSYAMLSFPLTNIPKNAKIQSAKISLYPINRVSTTIEKYGEWSIGLIDQTSITDITNYSQVDNCRIKNDIGRPTESNHLTQGIWRFWGFSQKECRLLEQELQQNKKALFRVEGPKELKVGRSSQMMQWDLGYGKHGSGLNYRPKLEILYTVEPIEAQIYAQTNQSYSKAEISDDTLIAGFDENGEEIVGLLEFNMTALPPYEYTTITRAYIELNSTETYIKEDLRFHLELLAEKPQQRYSALKNRITVEKVGYDISANELKNKKQQLFVFDTYSLMTLNQTLRDKNKLNLLLKPTISRKNVKDKKVEWFNRNSDLSPKLVVHYIHKRRASLPPPKNVKLSVENGKIRLDWNRPKHKDFLGVFVVRNPFHTPQTPEDGNKIYAGKDNYTHDLFGTLDVGKYFALFSYDTTPNYSEPVAIEYKIKTQSTTEKKHASDKSKAVQKNKAPTKKSLNLETV